MLFSIQSLFALLHVVALLHGSSGRYSGLYAFSWMAPWPFCWPPWAAPRRRYNLSSAVALYSSGLARLSAMLFRGVNTSLYTSIPVRPLLHVLFWCCFAALEGGAQGGRPAPLASRASAGAASGGLCPLGGGVGRRRSPRSGVAGRLLSLFPWPPCVGPSF